MVSKGVAIFGLGLVAVNTATNGTGAKIRDAITGDSKTEAHTAFVVVAMQIVFILLLSFLAEWSPDLGLIIVALLIGLWMVWAVMHADKINSASHLLGINTRATGAVGAK